MKTKRFWSAPWESHISAGHRPVGWSTPEWTWNITILCAAECWASSQLFLKLLNSKARLHTRQWKLSPPSPVWDYQGFDPGLKFWSLCDISRVIMQKWNIWSHHHHWNIWDIWNICSSTWSSWYWRAGRVLTVMPTMEIATKEVEITDTQWAAMLMRENIFQQRSFSFLSPQISIGQTYLLLLLFSLTDLKLVLSISFQLGCKSTT